MLPKLRLCASQIVLPPSLLPRGSPVVKGKMCVMKKGGALQNEVKKGGALENEGIWVINLGGERLKWSDKKTGATPQKVMSQWGMGAEQFDRRIIRKK